MSDETKRHGVREAPAAGFEADARAAPAGRAPTKLKLVKIGNSVGVVLPKALLEQHNLVVGDEVFLTPSPDGFRLTPYGSELERQMAVAEDVMRRYRNALRTLAK